MIDAFSSMTGSSTYRPSSRSSTLKHEATSPYPAGGAPLKGSYSFTPRIFLQATVQYNEDSEDVGSNIRFGWLNTAGTGLFLVYNDTEHRGPFRRTGIPAGPVDRTFVVKFTKQFGSEWDNLKRVLESPQDPTPDTP